MNNNSYIVPENWEAGLSLAKICGLQKGQDVIFAKYS